MPKSKSCFSNNFCHSGAIDPLPFLHSPKCILFPLASTASTARTLSTILPYLIDLAPQLLFAVIPPMVALLLVETSTGKNNPYCFSIELSWSRTIPGCTTAIRFSASTEMRRFKCLLTSMMIPSPMVCPHCEVPAPRIVTETPISLAILSVTTTSSCVFGTTAPSGFI